MTLEEMLSEIKAAMERHKMTARAVASAVGKSEQEVGQWLNGRHRPSLQSLDALARAVGLEVVLQDVEAPSARKRKTKPAE